MGFKNDVMKTLKTVLTIAGLLVIGFTAGFFTNRELIKRQIQKVGDMGGGPRIHDHIFNKIEATAEQQEKLTPIIKEYGREMGLLMRESRTKRRILMDSMFAEIKPFLTSEQQSKLVDFRKRYFQGKNGEGDRGKRGNNIPPKEKLDQTDPEK